MSDTPIGTPGPLLDAHLMVERDRFRLDAHLSIAAGEVVALLGPNGAGKTTALRALAGLLRLTAGHIRLGGETLDDPSRRVWVAPERRHVGVVFQEYLLFPHLSALDNVAFGPRSYGMTRQESRQRAAGWLARVGLSDHARVRPRQLSGGQAQRVALARALAVDPALLLLDEPLAALDAGTRVDTRAELHRHLGEHPGATLLVTHDPLDALVLADRLVIIENGQIVQEGDAATVTAQPRTDYVARLVGLNLYRGHAHDHAVRIGPDFTLAVADTAEGDVFVAFPPTAVALHARKPEGSPRNTWPATITAIQRHGDNLRVQLAGPVTAAADITPAAATHLRLARGQQVWAAVKAVETRTYPATSRRGTPTPPPDTAPASPSVDTDDPTRTVTRGAGTGAALRWARHSNSPRPSRWPGRPAPGESAMQLSIRNRFPATVVAVTASQVMGTIKARLNGGQEVIAAITLEAIQDLGLIEGQLVQILIKSTEIALATAPVAGVSIRNQIPGTIRAVENGVVMTTVKVDIGGDDVLTAAITKDAAEELDLTQGQAVTALVKSTDVSLAIG